MYTTNNQRTLAIGVSALALTAAGLATLAFGGDSAGGSGASADAATAGKTATVQADFLAGHGPRPIAGPMDLRAGTSGDVASVDSADENPAAEWALDRPTRITTVRAATGSTPRPTSNRPMLSVDVNGPVTAHVTVEGVIATANSAVRTAGQTVTSTRRMVDDRVSYVRRTVQSTTAAVDRAVQSLPVKASATTGPDGTHVSVSALGYNAGVHVR